MASDFASLGRRRRKWISFCYYGCQYDEIVMVVMRCPVIDGIILIHLAWQHKIVSAS